MYTTFGELSRLTVGGFPKQVVTTNTYEQGSRRLLTTNLDKQTGTTASVDATAYTYSAAGDTTSASDRRDTGATDRQCFTYDRRDQLTQAWTDTGTTTTQPAPSIAGLGRCTTTTPTVGAGGTVGGPSAYWLNWTYDAMAIT